MVEQYEFSRLMAYSLRGDGRWQEDQTDHAEDENEEDDSGAADTTITCAACQTDLVGFGELWEQMKNRDFYWPDLEE
jgi:class 3 adenylate cyclase